MGTVYGSTSTSKRTLSGVLQEISTQAKNPPLKGATLNTPIRASPMKRLIWASELNSLMDTKMRESAVTAGCSKRTPLNTPLALQV